MCLPKIIAAHDLSGLGKASLGAAIPILSAMGSYVCALPTAVLSTITGVYEGFSITDLTDHMKKTVDHWDSLGVSFQYLYSGFLGSPRQVDIILDAARRFGCSLVVDPVFGDHGQLYPTMDEAMVDNMRRLVCAADYITPNLTEAQFLLKEEQPPQDLDGVKRWLVRLSQMGPRRVVITSCALGEQLHVCAYDRETGQVIDVPCQYIPVTFHGTGDMFTSVLVGAAARGDSFEDSIHLAVEFVRQAIEKTIELQLPPQQGAAIEKVLHTLL